MLQLNHRPRHFVRYGTHTEQRFLTGKLANTYEGLFLNANMVAWAPAAMAAFVGERVQKPYCIDPLTHGFQDNLDNLKSWTTDGQFTIKSSISKLIQAYGDPIESRVLQREEAVLPEDFAANETTREFVGRVLSFQTSSLPDEASDLQEYFEFAGVENPLQPFWLVAPYFYMSEKTFEDWLPVNIRMVLEAASQIPPGSRLAAELLISPGILKSERIVSSITKSYSDLPCNVVHLWIDGFEEWEQSIDMLQAYVRLIKNLGRPVVALYGSYLSICLANQGILEAVCHGPGYGESREAYPVGGGIPRAQFYHPQLHKRLGFGTALSVVREHLTSTGKYLRNVCTCPLCQEIMSSIDDANISFGRFGESKNTTAKRAHGYMTVSYSTSRALELAGKHFMYNKHREFCEAQPPEDIVTSLSAAYSRNRRKLGLEEVHHCKSWAQVLEGLEC